MTRFGSVTAGASLRSGQVDEDRGLQVPIVRPTEAALAIQLLPAHHERTSLPFDAVADLSVVLQRPRLRRDRHPDGLAPLTARPLQSDFNPCRALEPACRQRLRSGLRLETKGNLEEIPPGGSSWAEVDQDVTTFFM